MTEEKPKKEKSTKKSGKKEMTSFDWREYVEETFPQPKAFIYYTVVNDLTFKSKEEVDKAYELFKQLGGL